MDEATHAYIDENSKLRDENERLKAANADLHSRLDELRRVFNPEQSVWKTPDNIRGPDGGPWSGRGVAFVPGETASGRLAEHAERDNCASDGHDLREPDSDGVQWCRRCGSGVLTRLPPLSDPAGGG